jgi:aminoglycoside phosphotransferase (APT) family kinase protein
MHEPGPLLAQGRAADVFEYGDGLVLRRYRSAHFTLYEAAAMKHVEAHGYPVPRVIETQGPDLVMERLDGPTMLDDLGKRPWTVFKHTRTLALLLKQLHAIPPPDWLEAKQGGGDAFVHLDLHPDNVMLTSRGPVVIDWSNAGRGDPDAEVADLWLIMSCADVPAARVQRLVVSLGRRLLVRSLLGHFDKNAIRRKLRVALTYRSRDRNMSEVELGRMQTLIEKEGR